MGRMRREGKHGQTPGKGRRIDRARRRCRAGRSGVPLALRGAAGRQLPRRRPAARRGGRQAAEGQPHAGAGGSGPARGARVRRTRRRPRPHRAQPRHLRGARTLCHARDHGRRRRAPGRGARLSDRGRRAQGYRTGFCPSVRGRRRRDGRRNGKAEPRVPRGDLPRSAQPLSRQRVRRIAGLDRIARSQPPSPCRAGPRPAMASTRPSSTPSRLATATSRSSSRAHTSAKRCAAG
ncbi:hypothetical protein ACVW0I_001957 [Bradyrhizobium sp. LM6.11]